MEDHRHRPEREHHYQPGWLFIPFGVYTAEDCIKYKMDFVTPASISSWTK